LRPRSTQPAEQKLLGINTESTAATTGAIAVSLAAAIAVLALRRRWLYALVACMTFAFTLLDAREAFHQHDEHRTSLVIAATAIAFAHLLASAIATRLATETAATAGT
jgi:hypothetical protein